jgi:hypothetical protein
MPPVMVPTLPNRTQVAGPSNHFLPSTRIFVRTGLSRTWCSPVNT